MNSLEIWMASVEARLKALQITDSPGIRAEHSAHGVTLHARLIGGGGSVTGMVFRGEYNPSLTYNRGDVVTLSGGNYAGIFASGLYIATTTAPRGNNPANGIYWAQIGLLQPQSAWI